MPRRAIPTIAVAVSLALAPATAFADGAGDEQYQDPLAAPTTPSKTTKKQATTTTPATSTPAATTVPASTTTTAVASPQSTATSKELPRTGTPAGLIGLAGASLILVGGVLRRRTLTQ